MTDRILIRIPEHFARIFDRANGQQFDYVINCGGETRHSQPDDVYEVRNAGLTVALGREVARRGIQALVECSTAHVYKSSSGSGGAKKKEGDKLDPWHGLAKWKLLATEQLRRIQGLRYVTLRLPHVYGEYDPGYFAMGITMARVHLALGTPLEFPFSKSLKVNTLYVRDAASALWAAAEWRARKGGDITADDELAFNVVDHGDTSQQDVADALYGALGCGCTFLGSFVSQMAKLSLDDVIDDLNEVNLQTWAELLENKPIQRPGPIGPFLERDIVKDQDMSIDGSLFESATGWKPTRERLDADGIRDMVESYKRMGWWP